LKIEQCLDADLKSKRRLKGLDLMVWGFMGLIFIFLDFNGWRDKFKIFLISFSIFLFKFLGFNDVANEEGEEDNFFFSVWLS